MKRLILLIAAFFLITALGLGWGISRVREEKQEAVPETRAPDIKFTVIEGWSEQDIAGALETGTSRNNWQHIASGGEFLDAVKNFDASGYPLIASRPAGASLEGFLFPDTYFLPEKAPSSTTISAILIKKALDNFTAKFTAEMEAQAAARGMSVYEILTLASIIERETGRAVATPEQQAALDDERRTVAGIFYNRLAIGMALESDATVNYASGKSDPTPSSEDLQTDSPYNTYRHPGLPPGPICNPSRSSIQAAVSPKDTDYYFFLHKQPSGEPVYGKTFEEHIANKQKYLR